MENAPSKPVSLSSGTPLPPTTSTPHRLFHLDNLRTSLTALVILHHISVPYGGLGSWQYRSRFHPSGSSSSLVAFNVFNQSYFMGSFFFLSGLMSSASLRRRGPVEFLKTKWTKLGIPIVVYSLFGSPVLTVFRELFEGNPVSWSILTSYWAGLKGVKGPVWFAALLLVFDSVYAFLPFYFRLDLSTFKFSSTMLLNIVATFLVRIPYPAGKSWTPLNLQLGYSPLYVISYILGTVSAPPTAESPSLLTRAQRKWLLCCSIISGASILGLFYYYPQTYTLSSVRGSINLVALSYVIWNETTGYLFGSTVLDIFRRNKWSTRKWGNVGRYSYAAFLVHPIVCVGMQFACDGWQVNGVFKTVIVGAMGILGSWTVGWGLSLVPTVGAVIT